MLGALESVKRSSYPTILFECNNIEKNKGLFDLLLELGYEILPFSWTAHMNLAIGPL
jgi:hypothetical protein